MGRGGWLRGRCGGGKGGKALRNFKELWSDMGALGGLGGLGRGGEVLFFCEKCGYVAGIV